MNDAVNRDLAFAVKLVGRGYVVERTPAPDTVRFVKQGCEELSLNNLTSEEIEAVLWCQRKRDHGGQSAHVTTTPLSPGVIPTQCASPPSEYGTPRWVGSLPLIASLAKDAPAPDEPRASPVPMPMRCIHVDEGICAECRALQFSDGTLAINHSGKE